MSGGGRLSIFPLGGALLFPRMHLPLHIFEPRYRALVSDALARDRRIGMIQPRGPGDPPPLFEVGCVGRIAQVDALDDGRFELVLEGLTRFRIVEERVVTTPFRQVTAAFDEWHDAEPGEPLASIERASLEREAKRFADQLGFAIDWASVVRLDDETLVNGIAQVVPFDVGIKQALLEAIDTQTRAELLVQAMQFARAGDGETGTFQ